MFKAGKPVVIFPEGSRTQEGHLHPGKPGIGVIVAETQCPVVPATFLVPLMCYPWDRSGYGCTPLPFISVSL